MTIFQKIFASFSLLIFIVISLSFVNLIAFFEVSHIYGEVSDDVLPELTALSNLRENWLKKAFEAPLYLEGKIVEAEAEWINAEMNIQESLAKMRLIGLRNEGIAHIVSNIHLEQIEDVNDRLNLHKDELAGIAYLENEESTQEHFHSLHEHIEEGLLFLDDLKYALTVYTESAEQGLKSRLLTNLTRVLVSVPVAVLLSILLSLVLTRIISRPISEIAAAATRLKQGHFDERVTRVPKGELGQLALAFNEMAAKLQNYYQNLEATIKERTKDLYTSEKKYRTLVDHAPAGVFVTNLKGEILFANDRLAVILGSTAADQIIGTIARDYYAIPEDRDEFLRQLKQNGCADFETDLVGARGAKRRVIISGQLEKEQLTGMIIDITERRQAEAKVRDLDQLKSQFITALTHVLRTPLSEIRWNLETVLSGDLKPVNKEQALFMRRALVSQNQILGLIRNMNTVLNIEHGKVFHDRSLVSLASLATSTASAMKPAFELKKVSLKILPRQGDVALIDVDAKKIRAIVESMLDNALRYTLEGGVVSLRLSSTKTKVRLSVTDTGIGIPKEEQKHIFERFFRASNAATKHTDGIGLSLHIAKNFVEFYKGTIGFSSKESEGSTFWFEVPKTAKTKVKKRVRTAAK